MPMGPALCFPGKGVGGLLVEMKKFFECGGRAEYVIILGGTCDVTTKCGHQITQVKGKEEVVRHLLDVVQQMRHLCQHYGAHLVLCTIPPCSLAHWNSKNPAKSTSTFKSMQVKHNNIIIEVNKTITTLSKEHHVFTPFLHQQIMHSKKKQNVISVFLPTGWGSPSAHRAGQVGQGD